MPTIGIAGTGLLGRLLAWQLSRQGHKVTVFDPAAGPMPAFAHDGAHDTLRAPQAAAFSAAGMLCPLAELDNAEPATATLGWRSIALWREIVAQLPGAPFFSECGSLLLAHRADKGSAQRVLDRITHALNARDEPSNAVAEKLENLSMAQLANLEPAVQGVAHAWYLPGEAQIDPLATMAALHDSATNVQWRWSETVLALQAGQLRTATGLHRFDWVFDVRGTGAAPDMPVRGVRGEMVWLHAPGLQLQRPLRLLHPRHRVYIVPRPGNIVLVGASEIESEDRSPVSLRSAVELMAAAHSVVPALAEARILRMDSNLRPALPDNAARIHCTPGLVSINGLFRHGWLLAPALMEQALQASGLAQSLKPHATQANHPLVTHATS
jgi:glycine oxidase